MFPRFFVCALLFGLPLSAQVTVVAVGDISCDPADPAYNGGAGTATKCRMLATSDVALSLSPAAVLILGDNQYENATLAKFQASYDLNWGRLKAVTHPVPGNHEYFTPGAAGYFAYFGAAAGDPAEGYTSFDLGGWRLIGLNSNCSAVGGCGAASPQAQWLEEDLDAHPGVCTLAYWHHPRFSSGAHGDDATTADFWSLLQAAGADLVLAGHDHIYERFAPQSAFGAADPAGIRQFVVGTGGRSLEAMGTVRANSEVRNSSAFGVLELKLWPTGYEWRFVGVDGSTLDSGQGLCHSALPTEALDFYTLTPCRLVDTRTESPLAAGVRASFPAAGSCGIPPEARALAVNVTAIDASTTGYVRVFPSGAPIPSTRNVSFGALQRRASASIVALGVAGEIDAWSTTAVDLVVDVAGYFVP